MVWNAVSMRGRAREPDWTDCTVPAQWRGASRIRRNSRSRTSRSVTKCRSEGGTPSARTPSKCWQKLNPQTQEGTPRVIYLEKPRGIRYESALVPFGEVVTAKIADGDKFRDGKLDSTWVKAVWVGRVDKSNEHLLLTTKGCNQIQSCWTHSRRGSGELSC